MRGENIRNEFAPTKIELSKFLIRFVSGERIFPKLISTRINLYRIRSHSQFIQSPLILKPANNFSLAVTSAFK